MVCTTVLGIIYLNANFSAFTADANHALEFFKRYWNTQDHVPIMIPCFVTFMRLRLRLLGSMKKTTLGFVLPGTAVIHSKCLPNLCDEDLKGSYGFKWILCHTKSGAGSRSIPQHKPQQSGDMYRQSVSIYPAPFLV